jgi:glycine/D-amino acid oxidase-like deaminating enzyme
MGPQVDPVATDLELPAHANVVVIGGGIIGVTAAMHLAERGLEVTVVEKGHIAGEQSSRNWGWCRQAGRDPREFDLIRESLRLWRGMNARVGADTGFATTGILFAARDEKTELKYTEWVRSAADSGIASVMARGGELARLLPGDSSLPRAALYCASDGRAEPQRAAPAIALAARRAGAIIVTNCAARGIETAGGRVVSVVTERGAIACDTVIVAGGAWSRRILKDIGVLLPQLKVRASVGRTAPIAAGPECALWDDVFAFRKRADGGYTVANGRMNVVPLTPDTLRFALDFAPILMLEFAAIRLTLDARFLTELKEAAKVPLDQPSPYEAARTLDPAPDQRYLEAAMDALRGRYAVFAQAKIVQSWAGFIDATPDAVPVISAVDGLRGLIVATGFSGHGFGISPGAGHLAADLASGMRPIVDPRDFRLSRFSDGSRPRPITGV